MNRQAQQRLEWLEGIAELLPAEFRERFALRVAALGTIDGNDPLFQMLDVLGFVTLALHQAGRGVVALEESVRSVAPAVAECGKHVSVDLARQVVGFEDTLSQLEERVGKAAAQEAAKAVAEMRNQCSGEIQPRGGLWKQLSGGGGKQGHSVLSGALIAIVATAIFVLGVWTGQFTVLVVSRLR
jgi:hypothetical protein